jgi:hypothetical protein
MFEPIITELSLLDKTKFDEVFINPHSARREIRSLSHQEKSGRSPLHRAAAYPLQQPRKRPRFSASYSLTITKL